MSDGQLSNIAPTFGRAPRKKVDIRNVAIGSALQVFEVTTLGQPFENIKTVMAAHRNDSLTAALTRIYSTRGLSSFWQGLIPWAWIEAVTKGGVLLFSQNEITNAAAAVGVGPLAASALGGMGGGVCQAYTTMGFCTFMKTVEVTRTKSGAGARRSSLQIAADVFRAEGVSGMYKGVNAVALRQATNWGSRFGFSRIVESVIRGNDQCRTLSKGERLLSSAVGGGLACWNQPIEVIRVEMQSMAKADDRPKSLSIASTARYIYEKNGVRGFYRGVTPRIGLSVYLTSVMVFGGDEVKQWLKTNK